MLNLNVYGYIYKYVIYFMCINVCVCVCVPIMAGESPLFAEVPKRNTT